MRFQKKREVEFIKTQDVQALSALVRVAIYRGVESREELSRRLGADVERLEEALGYLQREGLIQADSSGKLSTGGVVIPTGAAIGWEAAVFDHYQALVTAISRKLAAGSARSSAEDTMGGATVSFELTQDHPLREEVHGLLKQVRGQVNSLWERVGEHNRKVLDSKK